MMSTPHPNKGRRRSDHLPPRDQFPTSNEIAQRAHDLFVAGGRRVTKIFEYWEEAEQELLEQAARKMIRKA